MAGFGFGSRVARRRRHELVAGPPQPAPVPATFTITQLATANRIYQRASLSGGGQAKGAGTIVVPVNVTTAGAIYARCRSAADGTTVLQPAWRVTATAPTGAQSLAVGNVDARLGWFYLDLSGDGTSWTNGTTPIGMGDLTALSGQSLAVGMWSRQRGNGNTITDLGITPSAYGMCFANFTDNSGNFATAPGALTWQAPATGGTYDSPFAAEFLNRQIAAEGVNQGLVGCATGGQNLRYFLTSADGNARLQAVLAAAGGAWRHQIWYQGHSDATYGVTKAAYQAGVKAVTDAAFANNSFAGAGVKAIGALPFIYNEIFGTAREMNAVRIGGRAFAAAQGWVYFDALDVALNGGGDGAHLSAAGNVPFARDLARTLSSAGNVGPIVTAATRIGQTLMLTLSNAGTALTGTGNWWERFKVYNAGSVRSQWTLDSGTIVSATSVAVHLSTDPGTGQALDLYGSWAGEFASPNLTGDMLRDNRDPEGIGYGRPLSPNTGAVAVAAPSPGGATSAPPTGIVASISKFDMTVTGGTFSAELLAGFGAVLSAGTALNNTTPMLGNTGMTVEGFFQCSAQPSGTIFSTGNGEGYRLELRTDGGGAFQVGDATGNLNGGPAIVTGKLYYIALQCGPSGTKMLIRNVTDGTNLAATTQSTAWPTVPNGAAWGFRCLNNGGGAILALTNGSLFHWSVWEGERWSGSAVTAPTTPLLGTEPGLLALYRLNGDGGDAVRAA